MPRWVRPLRYACAAAAALLLVWWMSPRFGAVYVGGWSMAPTLTPGDLALYRRGPVESREGEVVLVRREDGTRMVHRVSAVLLDGSVRTRGDAGEAEDLGATPPSRLDGVVFAVLPCGRLVDAVTGAAHWCYNRLPIADTRR